METYQAPPSATVSVHSLRDNVNHQRKGVIRGYTPKDALAWGKLVRVVRGAAFDVTVDLPKGSPTFGRQQPSVDGHQQAHAVDSSRFAHGFETLEEDTVFHYKVTALYHPSLRGGHGSVRRSRTGHSLAESEPSRIRERPDPSPNFLRNIPTRFQPIKLPASPTNGPSVCNRERTLYKKRRSVNSRRFTFKSI